jgi:SAM-dependent methyltransferase
MVTGLPVRPNILDIGCGPGSQSLELARLCPGTVYAVDNHPPSVARLKQAAAEAGLADRVVPLAADMKALPFPPQSFDLIWAEGSIYIVGVAPGLALWRPLLNRGGSVAFTEATWLRSRRPAEVDRFWEEAYPAMCCVEENMEKIRQAGFSLQGHFILPAADWWTEYYEPLSQKLPGFRERYAGDEEALQVLALEEQEMDLFRRCSDCYGYVFYVAKLTHGG